MRQLTNRRPRLSPRLTTVRMASARRTSGGRPSGQWAWSMTRATRNRRWASAPAPTCVTKEKPDMTDKSKGG